VVATVEDGKVAVVGLVLEALVQDLRGDLERLILLIGAVDHLDRVAVTQLAPQLLVEDVRVVGDELVG